MKIIDNKERVLPLLKFKDGIFYYLQVIARKKDNPGQPRDFHLFSRCITSIDVFEFVYNEIKVLCNSYNARCYISLFPRSIEKFTKKLNLLLSSKIVSDAYTPKIFRSLDSIALDDDIIKWKGVLDNSRCMLDVDDINLDSGLLGSLDSFLAGKVQVESIVPSVSGVHYICSNFYPGNLGASRIDRSGNWEFDVHGRKVTVCRDVNTILYSCTPEKE